MQNQPCPVPVPSSGPMLDADCVLRAVSGDAGAFKTIMQRHYRLLFRTARSILKSDCDAEDAVQEAYLHAWRALAGFRADASLSTWLVRIVVNEALGRLRRREASSIRLEDAMESTESGTLASLTADPDRQPECIAMRAEFSQWMQERIERLPDVFRSVFLLRAMEEMSVEEVAQTLGIPEATVRTRFFRARRLLRAALTSDIGVASGGNVANEYSI